MPTERRGITLLQFEELLAFVSICAHCWCETVGISRLVRWELACIHPPALSATCATSEPNFVIVICEGKPPYVAAGLYGQASQPQTFPNSEEGQS